MNSLSFWLLCDGKPGHENQSLGLADAIARRMPCEVHRIFLAGHGGVLGRVNVAMRASQDFPKPDFIIGAGHATHFSLLWLARKHRAKSIVLMRPSLLLSWFDLCIVPAHDFADGCVRGNVIITQGALNRVLPPEGGSRSGRMILIGGPSGTHGWNGEALLDALAEIAPMGQWQLTDSRRTPDGFTDEIKRRFPQIEIFSHQETTPDWLPARLAASNEVWVTEDSVSMVYEALSSGAAVGLLPVPRRKEDSRVIRGLEKLVREGSLTKFYDWVTTKQLKRAPSVLREADRCAEAVIKLYESSRAERRI